MCYINIGLTVNKQESNMTLFNFKKQRGAIGGIPEQVIAIAVGVLLVSGMVALGSKAFSGSTVNQELANFNQMITGTRDLFSGAGNYGADNANLTRPLFEAGVIPASYLPTVAPTPGATTPIALVNRFGGALGVIAETNTTTGSYMVLDYNGINKQQCILFTTKLPPEGIAAITIAASGTAITTVGAPVTASATPSFIGNDLPLSPVEANAACAKPVNKITFWVK